jgi:hypothetical protein
LERLSSNRLLRSAVNKPDYRYRRPRRRAAKQRDELATPDASCHLIPPAEGVVRPNDSTIRSGISQNKKGLSASALTAYLAHMLQRTLPAGFIAPCLPTKTGPPWPRTCQLDGPGALDCGRERERKREQRR